MVYSNRCPRDLPTPAEAKENRRGKLRTIDEIKAKNWKSLKLVAQRCLETKARPRNAYTVVPVNTTSRKIILDPVIIVVPKHQVRHEVSPFLSIDRNRPAVGLRISNMCHTSAHNSL